MNSALEEVRQNREKCLKASLSLQSMYSLNEKDNELVSWILYIYLRLARATRDDRIRKNDGDYELYGDILTNIHNTFEDVRRSFVKVESESMNAKKFLRHRKMRQRIDQRVRLYALISKDEEGTQSVPTNFKKEDLNFLISAFQRQLSKLPEADEADQKMEYEMMKEDIEGVEYEELVCFLALSARDDKDHQMHEIIREEIRKHNQEKDGNIFGGTFDVDLKENGAFRAGDEVGYGVALIGRLNQYTGQFSLKGEGQHSLGNKWQGKPTSSNGD